MEIFMEKDKFKMTMTTSELSAKNIFNKFLESHKHITDGLKVFSDLNEVEKQAAFKGIEFTLSALALANEALANEDVKPAAIVDEVAKNTKGNYIFNADAANGYIPQKGDKLYIHHNLQAPVIPDGYKLDAERLDFVLDNAAFIIETKTDVGGKAFQLISADEDENFNTLSGETSFFKSAREAIDAAMLKAAPLTNEGKE